MTSSIDTNDGISLKSAEKQFASLLLQQLNFILKKPLPAHLEAAFREINEFLSTAKHIGIAGLKEATIFTPGEITQLVSVIPQLPDEYIRAILKEAMRSHKIPIPNDL